MLPVDARAELAGVFLPDAITQAEIRHIPVRFNIVARDMLTEAKHLAQSQRVGTGPIHILLAGWENMDIGDILRRADLHWSNLVKRANSGKFYSPGTISTSITNGLIEAVNRAAEIAKESHRMSVLPHDLLEAAAESGEVIEALREDEGAIERLRDEIVLYRGQQSLKGILFLLTSSRLTREDRMELFKGLKNAAGLTAVDNLKAAKAADKTQTED